jgi:glycosyltransferase involved in cell wall biosynthesis
LLDPAPFRERLGIPVEAPVLLSPRRWYANSNIPSVVAAHAELPDAVYLVLKRFPGFEPDGGLAVERVIAASPARDRIRVVGELAAEELPALYAAADVVISLCTTDGTPVSALEAMAVGRPVVAFGNASLAEWVSAPGGCLVTGLEPGPIAAAVSGFLFDPAVRARAAAHNLAVIAARADRGREFDRMDEIYRRLVPASAGG